MSTKTDAIASPATTLAVISISVTRLRTGAKHGLNIRSPVLN